MEQLSVGDYMITDYIIIERKTSTDFVQSIITGHLFNQCARLRKTGKIPLIIVEGNPYNTRHDIKPEAIKGALLSVNLRWQIPIIKSYGKEDTVRLMIMASKQQINSPVFVRLSGKKPKKLQKQQHYFVQSMPGLGPELAKRLLTHFGTIKKIITSDVKTLQMIDGIGETKATKLFQFFRLKL
jgi:Fanconi anemia group M protein